MTNWRRKEELDLIAACGRVVSAHPQEVLAKPSEALKSELYKAFKALSCSERRTQRSTIIKCHQLFKRFVTMQASTSHPIEITGKSLREAKRKRSIRAPLKKGVYNAMLRLARDSRAILMRMNQNIFQLLDQPCETNDGNEDVVVDRGCEGKRAPHANTASPSASRFQPEQDRVDTRDESEHGQSPELVSTQTAREPTEQRMAGVEGDVEELPMLEHAEREDGVPLVQRIVEMASNTVEDINSFTMDLLRKHRKVMNKVLVRDASAAILEGESDVAAQFERLFQKQATDAKELAQMMHAQMNASIYMA
ncbi:hypothetical protein PC129_g1248 [Phytophthora cactorum]|uniref:Uncharacterized protein n=2 Tax=Phytophthora cactorum TaxID=29920 RepID=A0A8T1DKB3_9STRA|nr:hypothetical protein PC113_g2356 [Phytophthora cactorum]KAG2932182.1 hypothetical protein PC114_g1888 [Phytophthora cactorum]KAG2941904.1 hypothetical protein PC115_g1671 [Phytophthora cactorum]KAG2952766.1 hypothetical protein PC117_g2506 [Phytophthora cactorum]KAG2996838.1 hypothetical protein PC118_g2252 [Phytophthora cactorum]